MKRHLIIYSLLFFLFCVLSCRNKQAVATEESSAHDLEQIKDSGELVVLTLLLISSIVGKTWVSNTNSVNNLPKV